MWKNEKFKIYPLGTVELWRSQKSEPMLIAYYLTLPFYLNANETINVFVNKFDLIIREGLKKKEKKSDIYHFGFWVSSVMLEQGEEFWLG